MQDVPIDDRTVQAYMATPDRGAGPGVLVCHPWWGLNDFIKGLCDRLASEGFIALAPDLYHGSTADTIKEAERLVQNLDRNVANREVRAAVDYLSQHPSASSEKIGAIGFSLGAGFALFAARSRPRNVRAVVLFYGTGGGKYKGVEADFQGHFAESDPYEPPSDVQSLKQRLLGSDGKVEFYTYPESGHWFFEEDRPEAYVREAAEKARDRTINFLRSRLTS